MGGYSHKPHGFLHARKHCNLSYCLSDIVFFGCTPAVLRASEDRIVRRTLGWTQRVPASCCLNAILPTEIGGSQAEPVTGGSVFALGEPPPPPEKERKQHITFSRWFPIKTRQQMGATSKNTCANMEPSVILRYPLSHQGGRFGLLSDSVIVWLLGWILHLNKVFSQPAIRYTF